MPRMPKKRTANLFGQEIEVVDRVAAETDIVACVRIEDMHERNFTDDLEGTCMVCSKPVLFRPYMKKGRKVCLKCLPALTERAGGVH